MAGWGKSREWFRHRFPVSGDAIAGPSSWLLVREGCLCLGLIILVFHIYAHSKDGPFVFDDLPNIANNPSIHISRLDWESLRRAAFESPIPTRPVANLSFALNYYFNQLDPKSFRLANVLIHLGNGLLLLFFLKATLRTPFFRVRDRSLNRFMPFAAVTIWLVNPLHTQSVSYIVQRMNSLAALFCLLAFVLYIQARLANNHRRLLFGGSLLAFLLALGSKENTVTLPVFIFLYEWYFFRDLDYGWLKRNYFWPAGILLFLAGMALLYLDFNPGVRTLAVYQSLDLTLPQRVMTQSRVAIFYVFLFLFPHPSRLNLDHHFSVSLSPLEPPTTILAMLVIVALLATAVLGARRERFLSFCILWFLGNLLIESSVPGLDLVFEHRTYLPTVLVSMVIVMLLYRCLLDVWARRAVLFLFVIVGTAWTHERNLVWADKIALWEDAVKKSPEKFRPNVNLGIAYSESGQLEKGVHHLQQAVLLKPDYAHPRINLAHALFIKGDYRQAEQHARAILPMQPVDDESLNILVMARNIVGKSLALQDQLEEALENFQMALQLNPGDADTNFNLALALAREGELERAAGYCAEALRIKPEYQAARLLLKQIRDEMQIRKPANGPPAGKAVAKGR